MPILERLAEFDSFKPLILYGFGRLLNDPDPDVRVRALAGLERVKR